MIYSVAKPNLILELVNQTFKNDNYLILSQKWLFYIKN